MVGSGHMDKQKPRLIENFYLRNYDNEQCYILYTYVGTVLYLYICVHCHDIKLTGLEI